MYSNSVSSPLHHPPPVQQPPPLPPNTDQPSRKRTKKDRACDLCRRKKIRCDYDQAYPQNSCTSCKSYNKTCAFKEAAKKRGPPKGYVEGLEGRLKRMEKLLIDIAASGNLAAETMKSVMDSSSEAGGDDTDNESYLNNNSSQQQKQPNESVVEIEDNAKDSVKPIDIVPEERKRINEPFSYVGSSSGIYLLRRLFTKGTFNLDTEEEQALPRPLDGHEEDLMVVRFGSDPINRLGFRRTLNPSWQLPPKDLTDYLIRLYFERMNPLLPILDEDQFYEDYHKSNHRPTFIPIIMAICRVTCRLLKKDDALVLKYKVDRAQLFREITKQMELYFDLDFLEPKIEAIQVLLLSASNAEKWGLQSTDWIATSIAVKMAQDLGLHRANTQQEGIPKKVTEAKRRLWWSAYIIDRWVCASLGRPLTISDADCDVEYPDSQDSKYTSFIYMVKLACILGDILRALCSPRARLMSEKGVGLENFSKSLEKRIIDWKSSLPAYLSLTDDELTRISRNDIDAILEKKLNNGAGKLRFAYCAVYLLSKRPFISMGHVNESTVKMPFKCQEELKISVDMFDKIDITNLLCGWSISSYCIAQTQTLLFLNYQSIDANVVAKSKAFAARFKERHRELEDYITEPSIVPFLETFSKLLGGEGSPKELEHSQTKSTNPLNEEQSSLWSASSGIEWQEMAKLLAETGYQI